MSIITPLIAFLLSTSLYPAATPPRSCDGAHAAASAAQADVKLALSAAHSLSNAAITLPDPTDVKRAAAETDSKAVHDACDGEIDTRQLRVRRTPPTDGELKQALERARKCDSRISILNELAVPYATKDPYVFALELYKQWHSLCQDKGLLASHGIMSLSGIVKEIEVLSSKDRNHISSIAMCCLGMMRLLYLIFNPLEKLIGNHTSFVMLRRYSATSEMIELSDKLYRDAQAHAPQIMGAIRSVTPLLPEIASVVEGYVRRDCLTVTAINGLRKSGKFEVCMLGDLEGLRDCTESEIDLRWNWITKILRNDLPHTKTLELLHCWGNPIAYIAPHAFAEQRALMWLNLGKCQLTCISRPMFAGLVSLKGLILNSNPISCIEPGAISQLPTLESLSLRLCALQTVPEDLQTLVERVKLIELGLDGNPLEQNPVEKEKKEKLLKQVEANLPQAID